MCVFCTLHSFSSLQMMWRVAVALAVLQLCKPALQADPSVIYQLQDDQEKPSEFCHYTADLSNQTHKEQDSNDVVELKVDILPASYAFEYVFHLSIFMFFNYIDILS